MGDTIGSVYDTVDGVYDAIVLAGGAARRLDGAAKPQLTVAGVRLIDHVLAAVHGASTVVAVGPEQATAHAVRWCRETPVGSGPVAAVAAAVALTGAPTILVLGADLPFVGPAIGPLLTALRGTDVDVARLVDAGGRVNHLAAAWRRAALVAALEQLGDPAGASMRALAAGVAAVDVEDPYGWGRDCDTWDDVEQARRRAADEADGVTR